MQQRLQNIGAVKSKMGDVLVGILLADHPIGDSAGKDHIIAIQVVQNFRVAEAMHRIDMHLVCLHIPNQTFHIFQLVWRRHKYNNVDHGASLSAEALRPSVIVI